MPLDHVTLLYRGPLASCNYTCGYCPFPQRTADGSCVAADREQAARFVEWLAAQTARRWSVFFTPQGEALIHRWHQEAVSRLAGMSHLDKVAVQTNLSCRLDWLAACPPHKIGLWCTYHPSQANRLEFVRRCRTLDELGVGYSVGCVGLREHVKEIERLRGELRTEVYLWVNALKRSPDYYDASTIRRIERIDPLFRMNLVDHVSLGRRCRGGETVFSVTGDGTLRRCHFVDEPLGNLYNDALESLCRPPGCPQPTCRCHIGYVHLEHLRLDEVFGQGILERAAPLPILDRL